MLCVVILLYFIVYYAPCSPLCVCTVLSGLFELHCIYAIICISQNLCVILLQKHNTWNIYSHEAATSFTYTTFDIKIKKIKMEKRQKAKAEQRKKKQLQLWKCAKYYYLLLHIIIVLLHVNTYEMCIPYIFCYLTRVL